MRILFVIFLILSYCATPSIQHKKTLGTVDIYNYIPEFCNHSNVLKQKEVKLVKDEEELIEYYKITFLVSFRDELSPILYGTLYYIDPQSQIHCMALPNKKIAVFKNQILKNQKDLVIQEICYPINQCKIYDTKRFYN